MKKFLSIAVFIILITLSCTAQNDSLIKVTDRLYVITGLGGNVTFLSTEQGVLLIDAGSSKKDGLKILNHVKSVTDKPIKYIVLTHYHYDHVQGICGIPGNPTIIGHKNIYKNLVMGEQYLAMNKNLLKLQVGRLKLKLDSLLNAGNKNSVEAEKAYRSAQGNFETTNETLYVFPDLTFDEELSIYLGSDTIKLMHPGNTHTSCEIVVEFTNHKALATGDLFFNHHMPYIDSNAKCNTANWIEQVKRLSSNPNYQIVIPGHGKISTAKDLMKQANYLTDLRAALQKYIDQKKALEQIKKEMKMPNYTDYGFQNFLPVEIDAVYKELTAEKK